MSAFNILVFDRDPFSQRLLSAMLKKEGYRPLVVTSVEHALDALEATEPGLMLLNVDRPETDLFELVKLSRFSLLGEAYLPAVLLTASPQGTVAARAEEAGIDAVLTKPVQPQRLLAAIQSLLEAHRPRRKAI
jgi:two-component system sensor histidine kinase RpfC